MGASPSGIIESIMSHFTDVYIESYNYFRACGDDEETARDCAAMSAERACQFDDDDRDIFTEL